MFIHSQSRFNPYSSRFSHWDGPAHPGCRPTCGLSETSVFSSQARVFMMLNALSTMMQGFSGNTPMPKHRSPMFGRLGGLGAFGPMHCTFGPSHHKDQAVTPAVEHRAAPVKPAQPQSTGAAVRPMTQSNSVSCGQASVAMAVNSLTGKSLTDRDINKRYGFGLLSALNSESRGSGYKWRDGGNFNAGKWSLLEQKLNKDKTPVLIGLNGPQFSPSGRGHIVTLMSVNGSQVKYADPADGKIKTTTRQAIERAPSHPDGKFIFYANRA